MKILRLREIDSTNSFLMREAAELEAPLMAVAHTQTAGRGQRGNSWESAPGENLTFSILFRPQDYPAMSQFSISEAAALAVVDFLNMYGINAMVKWANDIYVGDKKICGILIQHSLTGNRIGHSVIGAGINVNQQEFISDAPNPVSMRQLTGESYDLEEAAVRMTECMGNRLKTIYGDDSRRRLHEEFMQQLWRCDGNLHPFADRATGEMFDATIEDVATTGPISLRLADGSLRTYEFKEVAFLF